MFDIDFNFEDFTVSSLKNKDIKTVEGWLLSQNEKGGFSENKINLSEVKERYIESLISESEFFLKIVQKDKIIGIIKGRLEFKPLNEVWIWYFIIEKDLRHEHLGSKVLENLTAYFNSELGKYSFFSVVEADNPPAKKFWKSNGFNVIRVAEDYFDYGGNFVDMLIYKK